MPISLLRKAPARRKPDQPVPTLAALSFPDAQPLLDADWVQQGVASGGWSSHPNSQVNLAPALTTTTAHRHSHHYTATTQYSYNNIVPRSIPIPAPNQQHDFENGYGNGLSAPAGAGLSTSAPSRGRLIGTPGHPEVARSRAPSQVRAATGSSPDFHRPFSPSYVVPAVPALPAGISRAGTMRRARQRRQAGLTVIVAGPSGSGKTCFIDALTGVLDPAAPRLAIRVGPTTSVVRHDVNVADERRGVVLLDTPGLPLPENGATRSRALRALTTMVEDRLSRVLAEESKVVRRKSDGGELVHLLIYVMDARTVLSPAASVEIDWDTVMEPPAKSAPTRPESELEPDTLSVAAKLSADDIEAFSIRANVLPLLTHADALTSTELSAVRAAVRRDLATVFGRDPLGPYGVLSAGQEYEDEVAEDNRSEHRDARDVSESFPYVVFAPEPGPGFTRAFRWGRADAADASHTDLPGVRNAIVDATDWLRQTTREVVYERFRTERLLNARGVKRV